MKFSQLVLITSVLTFPALSGAHDDSAKKILFEQGRSAGLKAVHNIPLLALPIHPGSDDFTAGGVNSMTPEQRELFREGFTEGLSKKLGDHAGWKYGLAAATPAVPSLGYEDPIYGEILNKMVIVGHEVDINPAYALGTITEADLLFVVKSAAINQASTPQELLSQIRGVYPAIELPASFTPSVVPDALGPRSGGDGILRVTNVAARLFVRGENMIPISGTRTLQEWEVVLNGGLQVQDLLVRGTGNLAGVGGPIKHLDNLKRMIGDLNAKGIKLKKGDLVSPGTAVAVRISNGTEQSFTATYNNLDPSGVVVMKVNFTPNGLTKAQEDDEHHDDDND